MTVQEVYCAIIQASSHASHRRGFMLLAELISVCEWVRKGVGLDSPHVWRLSIFAYHHYSAGRIVNLRLMFCRAHECRSSLRASVRIENAKNDVPHVGRVDTNMITDHLEHELCNRDIFGNSQASFLSVSCFIQCISFSWAVGAPAFSSHSFSLLSYYRLLVAAMESSCSHHSCNRTFK